MIIVVVLDLGSGNCNPWSRRRSLAINPYGPCFIPDSGIESGERSVENLTALPDMKLGSSSKMKSVIVKNADFTPFLIEVTQRLACYLFSTSIPTIQLILQALFNSSKYLLAKLTSSHESDMKITLPQLDLGGRPKWSNAFTQKNPLLV